MSTISAGAELLDHESIVDEICRIMWDDARGFPPWDEPVSYLPDRLFAITWDWQNVSTSCRALHRGLMKIRYRRAIQSDWPLQHVSHSHIYLAIRFLTLFEPGDHLSALFDSLVFLQSLRFDKPLGPQDLEAVSIAGPQAERLSSLSLDVAWKYSIDTNFRRETDLVAYLATLYDAFPALTNVHVDLRAVTIQPKLSVPTQPASSRAMRIRELRCGIDRVCLPWITTFSGIDRLTCTISKAKKNIFGQLYLNGDKDLERSIAEMGKFRHVSSFCVKICQSPERYAVRIHSVRWDDILRQADAAVHRIARAIFEELHAGLDDDTVSSTDHTARASIDLQRPKSLLWVQRVSKNIDTEMILLVSKCESDPYGGLTTTTQYMQFDIHCIVRPREVIEGYNERLEYMEQEEAEEMLNKCEVIEARDVASHWRGC